MSKEDLINQIAIKIGGDTKAAANFLEAFISSVQEILHKGDTIFIPGLGNFEPTVKTLKEISR